MAAVEGVEMVRRKPAEITSGALATALYRAAPPRGPSIELSMGLLLLYAEVFWSILRLASGVLSLSTEVQGASSFSI